MIITNNETFGKKSKHLTMTAKRPHAWEFIHDSVGYNYRLPNINAAVGCAQMEVFPQTLENKRQTALAYREFFHKVGIPSIGEPENAKSNYWLNAFILSDRKERDSFLEFAKSRGVQARPPWTLMNHLPMYRRCQRTDLETAQWFEDHLVNIPSSVRR